MTVPFSLPRSARPWLAGGLAALLGLAIAYWPPLWTAAILSGIALLFIVTVEPLAGLALALWLGPAAAWEVTFWGNPLSSGQLLLFLTLGAWLGQGVLRRRLVIPRLPLNWPLTLFLLVGAISLWRAVSVWDGIKELGKWLEMLLVMWLVVDRVGRRWPGTRRQAGLACVVGMLLLSGLSQAALGVWQFAGRGTGPEAFQIFGRYYRAFGTFQQPNPFGGHLSLTLALAAGAVLGLIAARPARRWQAWVWPALLLAACALLVVGLLGSWSRGAWLNCAAALSTLAFLAPRRRTWGIGVALGAVCLLAFVWQQGWLPTAVADRLTGFVADFQWGDIRGVDINDENYAVLERLAFWQSARDMARRHPWLGVGLGNYAVAYPAFALINWPHSLGHAHNYYLNLLAEVGVAGLLVYLALWSVIFVQAWRCLGRLDWPERGLALGLMAAWIGLSVHNLLDNLYVNNLYIHLGAMFGLLMCLRLESSQASPTNS